MSTKRFIYPAARWLGGLGLAAGALGLGLGVGGFLAGRRRARPQ